MRYHTILRTLLAGSTLLALSSAAIAEEETKLDLITVIISKVKQSLADAVGGVSVATRKDLEQHGSSSVSDVLAPMPGVSTEENVNDPAQAVNVRGLQDFGRVAVTIDGARQNFQRTGHNADGMFYFEPEMMQQVTVTRGPVANVYGSGAIGGVVSFETIDSLSFLKEDENFAVQERLRYSTNGDGLLSGTTGAVRLSEYGGLLGSFVYRDSDDNEDGDGDTVADSNREIQAGLVKATLTPTDGQRLDVSYLVNNDDFANGSATSRYGNEVKAETLAAKYEIDAPGNDLIELTASAYWTGTHQDQERLTASNPALIGLHRTFDIDTYGADVFNTSRFEMGGLKHSLTVGADIFQDNVKVVDPISTADLFTPSGERTAGGAFVQDQVEIGSMLEFIVAGRFDAYKLEGDTVDSDGTNFSPKATVVLKPFADTSLHGLKFYGTYAEGYRAPSVTETMIGGFHPAPSPFQFLPNPDLVPETAQNFEAGLTGGFENVFQDDDSLTFRAGAFRNKVKDYIGAAFLDPDGDSGSPTFDYTDDTYQYVNISRALLWGVELEMGYDAGWMFASVAGSHLRGDDESTDTPLATVPADKLVTTLGFRFFDEKATIGGRWFAVAEQDRVPAGSPTSEAYDLVNLFGSYQLNENLFLAVNVDNVFDKDYRAYMNGTDSPGRSFMFTVTGRLGG
jgi:hemoglobin/transferrin/lactoferrin receptor protein